MMNHTSTLKRLRLKEILGKCVRKTSLPGVGVPGFPRENNAVARYMEFFSTPPPGSYTRGVRGTCSTLTCTSSGWCPVALDGMSWYRARVTSTCAGYA